uniref:GLTSCR protein conserved domain-containing protein n=1 Tax=Periophthalmus magnuspinnatus TaxID=409849 RepID=A0A3B4AQI6_9GOBI
GHVSEVQPTVQLSANEPPGLPRVSVDLDFLEDDDILGGSPGGESGSNGIGTNHEPCDILQQSLAEANITEQSLQEAEAELDLGSFGIPGLTQVVQTLPDASLTGAGGTVGVGIGVGGAGTIFTGGPSSTATPPNAAADMLGSVLAQQGLQLQPQVMNKAISVQPFMQPVGLGNVTLQPISSLHTLPNGSQPGLGIGQIQVVGQPTVMTINQSGQPILAKAMGGYQLHQSGPEISGAGSQAGLGSSGSGLLIQGNKATLGSPALNGPTVCVSSTNSSSSGSTVTAPAGIVGFGNSPLASGIAPQPQTQGQIMQNVIIQRTPTPIQPKPPQGGAIQPKLYKQQQPQPTPQPHQNDGHKGLGLQQIPVSAAQNVAFLAGKPGSNVVLSTQATSQASQFSQTLFKPQAAQASGKPLSVHLLNQSGSIVIPSQTVLQGQNPQFVQLQAGGQILTQHPGGHIITSQGPGGQLIANQILTTNQNINLGQVLTSQGPSGAAHILSGPIQLQPGQMGTPTLFQMPVSLAQTHNQAQTHTVTGHAQTVIQGMPIQNPLMLGQVEGLSPAVSLQTNVQPQTGGVPSSGNSSSIAAGTTAQGQPECVTVLGSSTEQTSHPTQIHVPQPSVVAMQPTPSASSATPIPSSSPSISVSTSSTMTTMGLVPPQTQQNPGRLVFTNQGSSMILSQESLQMFLQQELQHQKEKESTPSVGVPASVIVSSNHITAPDLTVHDSQLTESWVSQSPSLLTTVVKQVPSSGHQQPLKIQNMSPAVPTHPTAQRVSESPQPSQSPLTLSQHIQSPHQQSRPPSQPQPQNQTPSRSCTPSHPPLFIIHNQSAESPQPTSQPQTAIQVQLQPQPTTVPGPHQQEMPLSQSPKPPSAQHQFSASPINTGTSAVVKAQVPVMGLSTEQQHHLQLVTAQIQTLSAIAQPSPQQKQLLEKLHQQPKPGVISSVGGLTLGKGGVQIQVLGTSLTQMPAPQPPAAAVQTHTTMKMPFTAEPSKEALLEQLRKQQGSALHPNYSAPFNTFEDTLHRLLPYHLYQGNVHSSEDYEKDEEFERVSSMLQKRTQAMVDKYRHLLFSESKQRLGPSAEMVMIDRMFIQEEKVAISQDRILAKERPSAPIPPISVPAPAPVPTTRAAAPPPVSVSSASPFPPTKLVIKQGGSGASVSWSSSCPTPPIDSTKSTPEHTVTLSSSISRASAASSSHFSSPSPFNSKASDDDDTLLQRTSKPPIKTYEARRRIGLKLKIKQDQAGFSKVVHNTALDPVHTPQPQHSSQSTQPSSNKSNSALQDAKGPPSTSVTTVIRTQTPVCTSTPSTYLPSVSTAQSNPEFRSNPLYKQAPSTLSKPSVQMNGTMEHHSAGGTKPNPTASSTSSQTTCRLPLRKTYRENVSPRVRPGIPGGGDEGYPRTTDSPSCHKSSSPSERTVIASV